MAGKRFTSLTASDLKNKNSKKAVKCWTNKQKNDIITDSYFYYTQGHRGINMKYKKEVFRSLALITQLGIHVMVPIFMCLFIGYIIDKKFGTSTILAFLIVGMLAGGRNAYMLAKGVIGENERDKK